ncbi:MAG: M20/M25/M40 family metallo-hydrolase [Planctomycetes bacterium]|nr:M20/M25/M40 family metallo-hydrolase [Planctomycetota bacterium]
MIAAALVLALAARDASPIREWRAKHEREILAEFVDLLSIPNVAADRENVRHNAAAIVVMMERRGLHPQLLETADGTSPPAVFGRLDVPGATRTLVLYAHYDGQPTDPSQWIGSAPWQPTLRTAAIDAGGTILPMPAAGARLDPEWRLYGRSTSDDKAGVLAILTAIDAARATNATITSSLKLFFEGEEEAGSPHLEDVCRRNADLLKSDAWLVCDGPVHQSGRKQVVFGVRGVTTFDLTVWGPKRPLHSGHYGNWAPNPGMMLARLLASMKDDAGRVTIAGFLDDVEPLGEAERRALAEAPDVDTALRADLGIARTEGAPQSLLERISLPSLNVDGIACADVGAPSRNVIPTKATATIDLRLVKGNHWERQQDRVAEHVRKQGYFVIDGNREPTDAERREHPLIATIVRRGGYDAERTPMDSPIGRAVIDAVQATSREPIVRMPTLGGSLPLRVIRDTLGAPSLVVPIANPDNNQHAENENLRLQNLWDGIDTWAAILTMKAVDQR